MKSRQSLIISIILVFGIVILVNIAGESYYLRLDLTEDQRYTLSNATENIINDLDAPVTVTAYFSEDLPTRISQTRDRFKELLIEYANRSDGNVVYEFVDPTSEEQNEREIQQKGIRPITVNVREENQMSQQKAYMGAEIKYRDRTEVIPFMQPDASMEYALSSNIKKLTVENKPAIGIIQGHGEPGLQQMQQVQRELSILYDVSTVTLSEGEAIDAQYKSLAIVAPSDSFPQSHLQQLDDFLARGGNLFIAYNRVDGDLQRGMGHGVNTGLENWLSQKGVNIQNNFVIDANAAQVQVRQQQGQLSFSSAIQFPYIPIITNFAEHPVTSGLESVTMQFVSPMEYTGDTAVSYKPIAMSSEASGTQNPPLRFNVQRNWTEQDFPLSGLTVGAALEGPLSGNTSSKMVVIGDGDFPVGQGGQQGRQGQQNMVREDNVSLMVNAIDWLSDDTGLVALRTKGVSSRPLEQTEDSTKTLLKYFNFLFPLFLTVVFGVGRMQYRKKQREKRKTLAYA